MVDQQLAVSSGVALRQEGERLHFVALGTGWMTITDFVLGLLGLVCGVNGVVQLGLAFSGNGGLWLLGAILTPLGGAFVYGALRCLKLKAARQRLPTSALRTLATMDLAAGALCDGAGRALAPLGDIRFEKRFQLGSSSRRLVVRWATGELPLVNGDPFACGLAAIELELGRRGFAVR